MNKPSTAPTLCARCRCELAGGLVADATQVLWQGKDVGFTAGECRLFTVLVNSAGAYVSYRRLYDVMHRPGFQAGGDDGYAVNVRTAIKRIRRKLAVAGVTGHIINRATVGYSWSGVYR